jgi:predicted alpha/beta-hydrolase family hydrolase
MHEELLTIDVDEDAGAVDAVLLRPADATAVLVLAHGAGAGMRHTFMESIATRLAERSIATLRFQFPYWQRGSRRPDRLPRLVATIAAAYDAAGRVCPGLPRLCGGKSMGGRMSSHFAVAPPPELCGLVFLGFPLHPAGKEGIERAAHLPDVKLPMLFVQGTRDKLAERGRMTAVVAGLGERATLHEIEEADHGFAVPKRTGRTHADVLDEIAVATSRFVARYVPTV